MIDSLRNFLILVTSLATIMIAASKFLFNLPLNLIKLNYKLDTEDASSVESVAGVFIAVVYGSLFLIILIAIIMNFLGAWHVKSTGVNEQPIYKVRIIILMIQVVLVSTEMCLILIFMDLKLTRKASTCMKIAAPIYIVSVIAILMSILGWFIEYSCYSLNSRLIINDTSICIGNLNLNNAEKNDTDVYLNGVNIISDNKKTGKLVIANSNKKLTFNIDPTIKLKEYDDLTLSIKGMKGIEYSYNSFKEILNFINQCSNIICYCIFILISAGAFYLNTKISKRRKYILETKDGKVECFWFLPYSDYYFVIDGNENKYINKKDVPEIRMEQINIRKKRYKIIKRIIKNIKITKKVMAIVALIIISIICFISIKIMKEGIILDNVIWTIIGAALGSIGSFLISKYYAKQSTNELNSVRKQLETQLKRMEEINNKAERYTEILLKHQAKLENGEEHKIIYNNGNVAEQESAAVGGEITIAPNPKINNSGQPKNS